MPTISEMMRRVRLHLGGHVQALAHQQGKVLQHTDHVCARLPLQHQAGDEELQVDEGNALAQIVQRGFERSAQSQLLHQLLEFHFHRLAGFGGDGFEATVDVMAGAHGAGEKVDGVGKLIFEFSQPPGAFHADVKDGDRADQQGQDAAQQQKTHPKKTEQQEEADSQRQRKPYYIGRAVFEVRLYDIGLQAAHHPQPGNEIAEEGQ